MKNKTIGMILFFASLCVIFMFFVIQAVGGKFGLEQVAITAVCNAPIAAASVVVAFFALQLNARNTQEPWLVAFRELHKDFWSDADMARTRTWLCCTDAYERELRPVLVKKLSSVPDSVLASDYSLLEVLDKFCALMVRVVYIQESVMSTKQEMIFKRLGYHWWIHQACRRPEVSAYIQKNWENLSDYIESEVFRNSFQGA